MPIPLRRAFALLAALIPLVFLAACGPSNSVRLMYTPSGAAVLPKPGAPRVTVVMFDDKRPRQAIGERQDGSSFMANALVSDWVSRALGEELARLGEQVSYASIMMQARTANPPYIASGVVNEIWIRENGPTSLAATVRLTVTLSTPDKVIYSESLSSTQERRGLPSASGVESHVADTLRDVRVVAAGKMAEKMR